ncbi:MAG: c-type cytochrome [Phycisphaera sp.]|nr:c-type cytochrome [Phycisphaera sp.]
MKLRILVLLFVTLLLAMPAARYALAEDDASGVSVLVDLLADSDDADLQRDLLVGMMDALKGQRSVAMPKSWPKAYAKLAKSSNAEVRDKAQVLALLFGDPAALQSLRDTLADPKAKIDDRRKALEALINKKDPQLAPVLHTLLKSGDLRAEALKGLAAYDDPKTPEVIFSVYDKLTEAEKRDAVSTLTSRPAYANALLDAMEAKKLPRSDVPAFVARQLLGLNDAKLTERLEKVWGKVRETSADKKALQEKFRKLLTPKAVASADKSNGRAIFTRTCAVCHTLYGEGGKIGPDLTGSNRNNLDYVLENVLDPSALVGKDYQMTVFVASDGRVVAGMIKEENAKVVTVQTPNDVVHLPRDEIKSTTVLPNSMMPEGLLLTLKDKEVIDLVGYLASTSQVPLPGEKKEGGKPGASATPSSAVPGLIEGESLKVIKLTAGEARPQNMTAFKRRHWSGDSQLWWTGAKAGDKLTLELPVDTAGKYELGATLTKARNYGIVRVQLDGRNLVEPIDLYTRPAVEPHPVALNTLDLTAGSHELTFEIVSANTDADPGHMFGLDCVTLKRVN